MIIKHFYPEIYFADSDIRYHTKHNTYKCHFSEMYKLCKMKQFTTVCLYQRLGYSQLTTDAAMDSFN